MIVLMNDDRLFDITVSWEGFTHTARQVVAADEDAAIESVLEQISETPPARIETEINEWIPTGHE